MQTESTECMTYFFIWKFHQLWAVMIIIITNSNLSKLQWKKVILSYKFWNHDFILSKRSNMQQNLYVHTAPCSTPNHRHCLGHRVPLCVSNLLISDHQNVWVQLQISSQLLANQKIKAKPELLSCSSVLLLDGEWDDLHNHHGQVAHTYSIHMYTYIQNLKQILYVSNHTPPSPFSHPMIA